jgi:hypothetical protein
LKIKIETDLEKNVIGLAPKSLLRQARGGPTGIFMVLLVRKAQRGEQEGNEKRRRKRDEKKKGKGKERTISLSLI